MSKEKDLLKQAFVKNPDIEEFHKKLFKLSLLKEGIDAIREHCLISPEENLFVIKETGEDDKDYEYRIKNLTDLTNATKKAIDNVTSRTFSKKVKLSEESNDKLKYLEKECDLKGQSITSFSKNLMNEGLWFAKSYAFCDYDTDERKPYFLQINTFNVYDVRYDKKGNIILFRVYYKEKDYKNIFEEEVVEKVNLYTLENGKVKLTTFRKSATDISIENELFLGISEIPVVEYYAETTAYGHNPDVPYCDLADKNAVHFRSTADQRNILHYSRVPFLFMSGFNEKEAQIKLGANNAMHSSEPDATVGWVESSGNSVKLGSDDIDKLEKQMEVLGAEMLVENTATKTATEAVIKSSETRTRGASMARNLQDAINKLLYFAKLWLNLKNDNSNFEVNTNIKLNLDSTEFSLIIAMHGASIISAETVREQANLRGLLGDYFDEEKEKERLDEEGLFAFDINKLKNNITE